MLQKLRDQTNSIGFRILAGALILVLAVFGFGAFNVFQVAEVDVASVDGDDITERDLAIETERERVRVLAQMGEDFDPAQIDVQALQASVLEQMIGQRLLAGAVDDMDLAAAPVEVDKVLRENPGFQRDGKFDENVYRRALSNLRYTPVEYKDRVGLLLAVDQLRAAVADTAVLPEWELRQNVALLTQQRDLAYLSLDYANFTPRVTVSEDDIALRYQENEARFYTPETVDVEFVELSWNALVNDPSIEVTEAELQRVYEEDKAAAALGEERIASHILLQTNDTRDDGQTAQEAEALRVRIVAGEAFDELAREYSEDPGSAPDGGRLQAAGRGVFDPAFEQALFALAPGEISGVVQSQFGYHIIRLEEIVEKQYPEFDAQKGEIELRLRRDRARELFAEKVRDMDQLAFETPDSLQPLADRFGLEVQAQSGVSLDAGDGVFGADVLREAAFSDDVLNRGYNSRALEYVDDRAVVLRVAQRHAPALIPLEDVSEDIRAEIAREKADLLIVQAGENAIAMLAADESVNAVADAVGVTWIRIPSARRTQPGVPAEVLRAAFDAPRPGKEKTVARAELAGGGEAIITVTRVKDGDAATMTDGEVQALRQYMEQRAAQLDFRGLYDSLEADASIKRL